MAARKALPKQANGFKKSVTPAPISVLPAPLLAIQAANSSAGLRKILTACIGHSKPKKPVSFALLP